MKVDENFNNAKNWFLKQMDLHTYKDRFVITEIERTTNSINEHEKILQNPDLRTVDSIAYLEGGYKYLEFLKTYLPPQQTETETEQKTYAAKYYALYHWLKIEMGTESHFVKNDNDQFVKSEIESYAKNKYPNCSPQGFYRSFKDLDISNRTAIAKSFGNGYKEILIALSNNDNNLLTHLKNYPS